MSGPYVPWTDVGGAPCCCQCVPLPIFDSNDLPSNTARTGPINAGKANYILCQQQDGDPNDYVHVCMNGGGVVGIRERGTFTPDGGNWARNMDLRGGGPGNFKVQHSGGTVGDLRYCDIEDAFTADFSRSGRAGAITFGDGLGLYFGMRVHKNFLTGDYSYFMSKLDTLNLVGLNDWFAPYYVLIDGGSWVLRLSPDSSNSINQSGAYTTTASFASEPGALPHRVSWATGTPALPGVRADLHWRESPFDSEFYELTGGQTMATHEFIIDVRASFELRLLTSSVTGSYAAASFDFGITPSWPP